MTYEFAGVVKRKLVFLRMVSIFWREGLLCPVEMYYSTVERIGVSVVKHYLAPSLYTLLDKFPVVRE
jgi:hypothetical protein